jgi:hypothetical protein
MNKYITEKQNNKQSHKRTTQMLTANDKLTGSCMIIAKLDHKFVLDYYGVILPPQQKWVSS